MICPLFYARDKREEKTVNFYINNQVNRMTFKGYPQDINLAEQVNREVHQMDLRSPSHILRRQYDRKVSGLNVEANAVKYCFLEDLFQKLDRLLDKVRKPLKAMLKRDVPYEDYMKAMKEKISKHKVANCGEMAFISQQLLELKGKKTDVVSFNIIEKFSHRERNKGVDDHTVLIMNLREKANVNDPQTWGREAIIVDPWFGIARRANLALRQIKDLMNFNPKMEYIVFEKVNYQDLVNYYKRNPNR